MKSYDEVWRGAHGVLQHSGSTLEGCNDGDCDASQEMRDAQETWQHSGSAQMKWHIGDLPVDSSLHLSEKDGIDG